MFQSLIKTPSLSSHHLMILLAFLQQLQHHFLTLPCIPLHTLLFPPNYLQTIFRTISSHTHTHTKYATTLVKRLRSTWVKTISCFEDFIKAKAFPSAPLRLRRLCQGQTFIQLTILVFLVTDKTNSWAFLFIKASALLDMKEFLKASCTNIFHIHSTRNISLQWTSSADI